MFEDIGLLGVLTDKTSTFGVCCCFQHPRQLQTAGFGSIVPLPVPNEQRNAGLGRPQRSARAKDGNGSAVAPNCWKRGKEWAMCVF